MHGDVVDDQGRRLVGLEVLKGVADQLDPAGQPGLGDPGGGLLDRVGVVVDPDDPAGRELLGKLTRPTPAPQALSTITPPAASRSARPGTWASPPGTSRVENGVPVPATPAIQSGLHPSHHSRSPEARLATKRPNISG